MDAADFALADTEDKISLSQNAMDFVVVDVSSPQRGP